MLEKNSKKCGNIRFALRDFLILRSEPMWNFILWALWSSRNPKSAPPYFCALKFISSQCSAKWFALRSTLLFMSGPPCFRALILSQECSTTCFAVRSSHLRSALSNFLRSGAHFISGALLQSFCFPDRWCSAPIWNFALRIYCNGCLIAIVFPLLIQKNPLRIDIHNMCDTCEEHLFSEKMEIWGDSRTKWKVKKQKHECKFNKN